MMCAADTVRCSHGNICIFYSDFLLLKTSSHLGQKFHSLGGPDWNCSTQPIAFRTFASRKNVWSGDWYYYYCSCIYQPNRNQSTRQKLMLYKKLVSFKNITKTHKYIKIHWVEHITLGLCVYKQTLTTHVNLWQKVATTPTAVPDLSGNTSRNGGGWVTEKPGDWIFSHFDWSILLTYDWMLIVQFVLVQSNS